MMDIVMAEISRYFEELLDNNLETSQYNAEARYHNAFVNLKNGCPKLAIDVLTEILNELLTSKEKFGDNPVFDIKNSVHTINIIKMIENNEIDERIDQVSLWIICLNNLYDGKSVAEIK
jgi:hypothetical protein